MGGGRYYLYLIIPPPLGRPKSAKKEGGNYQVIFHGQVVDHDTLGRTNLIIILEAGVKPTYLWIKEGAGGQ